MRFNKLKFIAISMAALTLALTCLGSCGRSKKTAVAPKVEIPEEFESADEIVSSDDSAAMVKSKIEASAQYGVGKSEVAFSFLQMSVANWQESLLELPGTYDLTPAAAAGMTISYVMHEVEVSGYVDGDGFRLPVKDLKKYCKILFGKDYIGDFVREKSEIPGYVTTVSSQEIVYTPVDGSMDVMPQSDVVELSDNGDGTYSGGVDFYCIDFSTGEPSGVLAHAVYTLAETDENPTGYRIVDWSMEVY